MALVVNAGTTAGCLDIRSAMLGIQTPLPSRLARFGCLTHLRATCLYLKLLANLPQTSSSVLQLTPLLAARNHDTCGYMTHANSRVGSIDALPSRTGGMKCLDLTLTCQVVVGKPRKMRVITICQLI